MSLSKRSLPKSWAQTLAGFLAFRHLHGLKRVRPIGVHTKSAEKKQVNFEWCNPPPKKKNAIIFNDGNLPKKHRLYRRGQFEALMLLMFPMDARQPIFNETVFFGASSEPHPTILRVRPKRGHEKRWSSAACEFGFLLSRYIDIYIYIICIHMMYI